MRGIFAYMGYQPLPIIQALNLLQLLENEQEADEKNPVGGHGAGIAYLDKRDKIILTKVGGTTSSPVDDLKQQMRVTRETRSGLILGHVRRASPEFDKTIPYAECTQPYEPACIRAARFTTLSAHNGFLQNYRPLRDRLAQRHHLESEKRMLIDSEVIAHLHEELLAQFEDPTKTGSRLYEQIEGNNAIVTIIINKQETHLHGIHRGRTRGLTIWTNLKGEALLCSREDPVQHVLYKFLLENNYKIIVAVRRTDTAHIRAHFSLDSKPNEA